ncbi:MAG: replication-associated recombination protein A [Alphaproteobacteria bacterium]
MVIVDTLFSDSGNYPLAEVLRPETLDQVVGQDHLLRENGFLARMLATQTLPSIIFWGPPGCGKTTIARLLASSVDYEFVSISAIFTGMSELRKIFEAAVKARTGGRQTLLFVDEIHRFNRTQQDSFLPIIEDGTIVLVGATTENPSFALNAALLSRAQVLKLRALDSNALQSLLSLAEAKKGVALPINAEARATLISMAEGDGRYLLGLAEQLFAMEVTANLHPRELMQVMQRRAPLFDKAGDERFNLMSALHKSLRGSDPNAALYYFARMMVAGEDPAYVARRLVRVASEDIGLSDPQALAQALAGWQAVERLGMPEGELAIAQVVVYLATAPKSNALYAANKRAKSAAQSTGSASVPLELLNASTELMKNSGFGEGYIYDHDTPQGFSGQNYFPESIGRQEFYQPLERGYEREIKKRLAYWQSIREARTS